MLELHLQEHIRFDDARPMVHALVDSGHCRLLLVCLKAGQALKDHRSASQVIAQCLQGEGLFYGDGVPMEIKQGSVVVLEPGHFHRMEGRTDCVILVTLSPHPAREGYPRDQIDRLIPRFRDRS